MWLGFSASLALATLAGAHAAGAPPKRPTLAGARAASDVPKRFVDPFAGRRTLEDELSSQGFADDLPPPPPAKKEVIALVAPVQGVHPVPAGPLSAVALGKR